MKKKKIQNTTCEPTVCPSCGHCPTCGRKNTETVQPDWQYVPYTLYTCCSSSTK